MATSPELSDAIDFVRTEGWDTDTQARRLVSGLYRALFHQWSNAYYQYQNGTLEEAQWLPHLREAEIIVSDPNIREAWSDWRYVYDDQFRELMDGLVAAHNP